MSQSLNILPRLPDFHEQQVKVIFTPGTAGRVIQRK